MEARPVEPPRETFRSDPLGPGTRGRGCEPPGQGSRSWGIPEAAANWPAQPGQTMG